MIVSKYKIIAFTKKENIPNVAICKGNVIILKIGLTIKNKINKTAPPKR